MKESKITIDKLEVSLQAPWVIYGKKIINLFAKDPSIKITTNYADGRYTMYFDSDNIDKLSALNKILKNYIQMGNVEFVIEYNGIDAADNDAPVASDWIKAFAGNGYFINVMEAGMDPFTFYYAVFKKTVISMFVDDLTDYCGNAHYIPADIVRDITNPGEVYPCTSAI